MTVYLEEPDLLEFPACPCCESASRKIAFSFEPTSVVRCECCGFFYLFPRLAEEAILQHYRANYFENESIGYESYAEQEGTLRVSFRRLMLDLEKRCLTGGTLLEVGCAYGYLLDEAKDFFSTRVGTDFSCMAVEQAADRADRVYEGGIDNLPADEKFDCIIAIHVIEHIYSPSSFAAKLKARLKPGGSLVLATPDMGSFWRLVLRSRWPFFKVPEHVGYFDKRSLSGLLRTAGFSDVHRLPFSQSFPLRLVASKLNLNIPQAIGQARVWLPSITIAAYGILSPNRPGMDEDKT